MRIIRGMITTADFSGTVCDYAAGVKHMKANDCISEFCYNMIYTHRSIYNNQFHIYCWDGGNEYSYTFIRITSESFYFNDQNVTIVDDVRVYSMSPDELPIHTRVWCSEYNVYYKMSNLYSFIYFTKYDPLDAAIKNHINAEKRMLTF